MLRKILSRFFRERHLDPETAAINSARQYLDAHKAASTAARKPIEDGPAEITEIEALQAEGLALLRAHFDAQDALEAKGAAVLQAQVEAQMRNDT